MSAKFELEAMRIALGEMLERIGRIEAEMGENGERHGEGGEKICGECREAAPDGSTVVDDSTVCGSPSGAEV